MSIAIRPKATPKARSTSRSSAVPRSLTRPKLAAPTPPSLMPQALLATLLDHSQHGIMGLDDELRIRFANKALASMFPCRPLHTGQALAAALPATELLALAGQSLALCEPHSTRFTVEGASTEGQGERHFFAQVTPLQASAGGGLSLMIYDITEEVLTERIRSDFVTNASHELRTPLTLINGYIETLQGGLVKSVPAMQRCLEVMEKHSKRMLRLIEDMLTISRFEGIDAQLKCESFQLRHCVEDVLEHLTPLIAQRQPEIVLEFPSTGSLIYGDRFYWDQILTNLIENALKENAQPGLRITIAGQWSESGCQVTVSDNGVGIPAEDLPFVFKRFFRCAKHHSSSVKGTGLGLSIVKRAIEAHGGTIHLTSVPGVATSFVMRVPTSS